MAVSGMKDAPMIAMPPSNYAVWFIEKMLGGNPEKYTSYEEKGRDGSSTTCTSTGHELPANIT